MRNGSRVRLSLLAILVLVLGASGCRSAADRRAGERATAEAEHQARETTLTSATLETGHDDEHAAALLSAEKDEYRGTLRRRLDRLDGRRERLRQDLDALDRTTADDWAALKARIDRELREREEGGTP